MTDEELAAIRARNERADYVHSAKWGENPIDVQDDIDRLLDEIAKLRETLEAVEHAVAQVYGHFSNGRLTKCNTTP